MRPREPRLPDPDAWRRHGVTAIEELHAGKQSRVFAATMNGRRVAVKLTDRSLADGDVLSARMRAVVAGAVRSDVVVAPLWIGGELVTPIGGWLMTVTPFVEGEPLDVTDPDDARLMGSSLGRLHGVLAPIRAPQMPPIAALADSGDDRSGWQLLHGDFSDRNIIATSAGLRVFDFDDCGDGPVEYDVANSLYMVMFDAEVSGRPARYEAFRPAFLDGYADTAGRAVDPGAVDDLIGRRIDALARWVADPSTAPIGVRTASPAWLDTLAGFVRSRGAGEPG